MDKLFPLSMPGPTIFYLVLYVFTLMIHVVFMNYVLSGTAFLAIVSLFRSSDKPRESTPTALVLRDWMPFAVSAAITAGVAPLLFVQILYQPNFYTANLLLFHRWMAILPALIVGFYLIYLLKSKMIGRWPAAARAAVGMGALACFLFTGYSWTENHLLSVQNQQVWSEFYRTQSPAFFSPVLLPRLGMWLFGGLPIMCLLVSWQLWFAGRSDPQAQREAQNSSRLLAGWSLLGLAGAGICAAIYYLLLGRHGQVPFFSPAAWPYLVMAALGVSVQVIGWLLMGYGSAGMTVGVLRWISLGSLLGLVGMTVVREVLRLHALGETRLNMLYPQHHQATQVGGLTAFLFFFVLNAILVFWCFRLVKKGRSPRR